MWLGNKLMKVIIKVKDVVELARRFERSPGEAMHELVNQVRQGFRTGLESIMDAEMELFLGKPTQRGNRRNGYTTRTYAIKGLGSVTVRVPRDRKGKFLSNVVPPRRHYDEGIERDMALLHLAGLSTRMLSLTSRHLLGIHVSPQEVSNSLRTIIPAAKSFMDRPLGSRRFKYLYLDGTNFHIRRRTVELEPTLVVIGVDESDHKSLLAMVQGDKESRSAWEMVFAHMRERGLEAEAVQLGVMDGLAGLGAAFREAFPKAKVARCWVHKASNVFPRVPRRFQAEFKKDWDAIQYAESAEKAREAFLALKDRWMESCADAVECLEKDLDDLLVHYEFPRGHWEALRTTNPIERVNKEF